MFRNKFLKYSTNPEVISIYPLIGIMSMSLSLVGYSIYRHLTYDSDYYLSYSKRKDPNNNSDYGQKINENCGTIQQKEIEWTYNNLKYFKSKWPWNVIFNNVKDAHVKD